MSGAYAKLASDGRLMIASDGRALLGASNSCCCSSGICCTNVTNGSPTSSALVVLSGISSQCFTVGNCYVTGPNSSTFTDSYAVNGASCFINTGSGLGFVPVTPPGAAQITTYNLSAACSGTSGTSSTYNGQWGIECNASTEVWKMNVSVAGCKFFNKGGFLVPNCRSATVITNGNPAVSCGTSLASADSLAQSTNGTASITFGAC
jgi:hypothetical protein